MVLQTVCWSETLKLSPTAQLKLSWNLQMSDQQKDQSGKAIKSLSNFKEYHAKQLKTLSWKHFLEMNKFRHCKRDHFSRFHELSFTH